MENSKHYALVTGGTSGIGYELAKLLAQHGYNLVLVARDYSMLDRVATEFKRTYGVRTITIQADLFDTENAFNVYDQVTSWNIQIEILINDAGQGYYGAFIHTDIRRELDIIQLNISSLVVLTKLFLRDMVSRGHGKIMNLSSIASKVPGPWHSVYHGTKAFVQSFTEAIRSENKESGVTITALLPGATATDFFNKANMTESRIVQEGELDDAAVVAKDGYEALMRGEDMIISGFKNKLQVALTNFTPDDKAANKMKEQQAPVSQ